MHIILSSDESGSFCVASLKSGEKIKACNCSKFKYNLKNQHKHYHCPICKEEKLKWNLDKNISVCKKKKVCRMVFTRRFYLLPS